MCISDGYKCVLWEPIFGARVNEKNEKKIRVCERDVRKSLSWWYTFVNPVQQDAKNTLLHVLVGMSQYSKMPPVI